MPRPRKDPKKVRVSIGVAVLPEIDEEVQAIANAQERTKSSVIEKLIVRGLVAFRQDGRLTDFEITTSDSSEVKSDPEKNNKIKPRRAGAG